MIHGGSLAEKIEGLEYTKADIFEHYQNICSLMGRGVSWGALIALTPEIRESFIRNAGSISALEDKGYMSLKDFLATPSTQDPVSFNLLDNSPKALALCERGVSWDQLTHLGRDTLTLLFTHHDDIITFLDFTHLPLSQITKRENATLIIQNISKITALCQADRSTDFDLLLALDPNLLAAIFENHENACLLCRARGFSISVLSKMKSLEMQVAVLQQAEKVCALIALYTPLASILELSPEEFTALGERELNEAMLKALAKLVRSRSLALWEFVNASSEAQECLAMDLPMDKKAIIIKDYDIFITFVRATNTSLETFLDLETDTLRLLLIIYDLITYNKVEGEILTDINHLSYWLLSVIHGSDLTEQLEALDSDTRDIIIGSYEPLCQLMCLGATWGNLTSLDPEKYMLLILNSSLIGALIIQHGAPMDAFFAMTVGELNQLDSILTVCDQGAAWNDLAQIGFEMAEFLLFIPTAIDCPACPVIIKSLITFTKSCLSMSDVSRLAMNDLRNKTSYLKHIMLISDRIKTVVDEGNISFSEVFLLANEAFHLTLGHAQNNSTPEENQLADTLLIELISLPQETRNAIISDYQTCCKVHPTGFVPKQLSDKPLFYCLKQLHEQNTSLSAILSSYPSLQAHEALNKIFALKDKLGDSINLNHITSLGPNLLTFLECSLTYSDDDAQSLWDVIPTLEPDDIKLLNKHHSTLFSLHNPKNFSLHNPKNFSFKDFFALGEKEKQCWITHGKKLRWLQGYPFDMIKMSLLPLSEQALLTLLRNKDEIIELIRRIYINLNHNIIDKSNLVSTVTFILEHFNDLKHYIDTKSCKPSKQVSSNSPFHILKKLLEKNTSPSAILKCYPFLQAPEALNKIFALKNKLGDSISLDHITSLDPKLLRFLESTHYDAQPLWNVIPTLEANNIKLLNDHYSTLFSLRAENGLSFKDLFALGEKEKEYWITNQRQLHLLQNIPFNLMSISLFSLNQKTLSTLLANKIKIEKLFEGISHINCDNKNLLPKLILMLKHFEPIKDLIDTKQFDLETVINLPPESLNLFLTDTYLNHERKYQKVSERVFELAKEGITALIPQLSHAETRLSLQDTLTYFPQINQLRADTALGKRFSFLVQYHSSKTHYLLENAQLIQLILQKKYLHRKHFSDLNLRTLTLLIENHEKAFSLDEKTTQNNSGTGAGTTLIQRYASTLPARKMLPKCTNFGHYDWDDIDPMIQKTSDAWEFGALGAAVLGTGAGLTCLLVPLLGTLVLSALTSSILITLGAVLLATTIAVTSVFANNASRCTDKNLRKRFFTEQTKLSRMLDDASTAVDSNP